MTIARWVGVACVLGVVAPFLFPALVTDRNETGPGAFVRAGLILIVAAALGLAAGIVHTWIVNRRLP